MFKTFITTAAIATVISLAGATTGTPAETAEALVRAHHAEVLELRAAGASADAVRAHRIAYEARLAPIADQLDDQAKADLKSLVLELTADRWSR